MKCPYEKGECSNSWYTASDPKSIFDVFVYTPHTTGADPDF